MTAQWAAQLGVSVTLPTQPSTRWVHNYPAAYTGLIWMRWSAAKDNTDPTIAIEVRWGPWVLRHRLTWPAERSVTVWHTKGNDGLSIPVILRASTPMLVEFHIGEGPADAWDLNPGWINDGR